MTGSDFPARRQTVGEAVFASWPCLRPRLVVGPRGEYVYVTIENAARIEVLATLARAEAARGTPPGAMQDWPGNVCQLIGVLDCAVVFTMVQNPFDRVLDAYLATCAHPPDKVNDHISGHSLQDVSLRHFIDLIVEQDLSIMGIDLRPQVLLGAIGTLRYDFIGRYESFHRHMSNVLRALRLSPPSAAVPDRLCELERAQQYERFYDGETVAKVRLIYHDDFHLLGYREELGVDAHSLHPVTPGSDPLAYERLRSGIAAAAALDQGERDAARAFLLDAYGMGENPLIGIELAEMELDDGRPGPALKYLQHAVDTLPASYRDKLVRARALLERAETQTSGASLNCGSSSPCTNDRRRWAQWCMLTP